MSMENVIKEETNKFVEQYKGLMEKNGIKIDSFSETLLRAGITQGIAIASMALLKMDPKIPMEKNYEIKNS